MNHKTVRQWAQQLADEFKQHPIYHQDKVARKQILNLLNIYYRHTPVTDLERENPLDLLGAVIAHWQLVKKRKPGKPMVRAYNPNFEEHGWQSDHSVIEVVSDDMAFLVDSLSMGLNRMGLTIFLTIHPIVKTLRGKKGELMDLLDVSAAEGDQESMIRFQVEKQLSTEILQSIEEMVEKVLNNVSLANVDWQSMKQRLQAVHQRMTLQMASEEDEELIEDHAFLEWINNDHFSFLAYCEFDLSGAPGSEALSLDRESVLGLFRNSHEGGLKPESVIPVLGDHYAKFPCRLVVTKSNARSIVHRPAYMDFIGIKRYNDEGAIDGLYCFVGLFTSAAYSSPPRDIPLLRKKVDDINNRAELLAQSHFGKALHNILDTFPRDTLFQASTEELLDIALGILSLQERQRTRVFVYKDGFNRFYTCLIYLPRERYNKEIRVRIQKVLMETFQGTEVEFNTLFSESILARVHFIVHSPQGAEIEYDTEALEQKVVEASFTWEDGLKEALIERYGEAQAMAYYRDYSRAFPGGFREDFFPRTAAADIARIEKARQSEKLELHFYCPILESTERVHFRLYSPGTPVSLSEAIPILENMGLSVSGERPYQVRHEAGDIWIHDFGMRYAGTGENLTEETSQMFQEAFLRVWEGQADNDGFNQLVLDAGLDWRQVVLLRAYSKYLKQIKVPYSQNYIIESLNSHPKISALLVKLFHCRFDPGTKRSESVYEKTVTKIEGLLESVSSLDQDRILRGFVNLIAATLRTNFFQRDEKGLAKPYLSFKIDPRQVSGMPLPLPMFEIYVFSACMEGVHLRGGKVARGGIRWSDRKEDYRTEVLGLMKAQMVKNTVIVPVGSKGGFIVKQSMAGLGREKVMEAVITCYKVFLRGMLDITDNLIDGTTSPPDRVVRHDEDDPYLVIAADKGTATFSDIANGVADDYKFWLGDAFASGGSAGYDHKKMGITAKGAWESVKRNFRELGTDIQNSDFTVVGVGDMSGDVFGNGMLLSRHIRLLGAFNHLHIFIDPDPDPESSFKERERLFKLPRSSWQDYDKALISKGGGIYARSAKSIPISEQARVTLGLKGERLTPNELIQQMLKAPVDLLWNGGIGTYVKAAAESNEEVRDKGNDALRVNGCDLRCKVVGEGGNLGVTQLGRVEFAAKGGLIYTDSIDNSAGVDCSDHEVNIKILLGQILANGDMTMKQRNKLLAEMTDEISTLVLANNYEQTQAISMVAAVAQDKLYEHARFIDFLEREGRLNRELEYLPNKKQIAERQAAGKGLTKPEISILLAYSKMTYFNALINSDIPDDDFLHTELANYFPKVLSERFHGVMLEHRLKREIISTHLTNSIVDHIGPGIGYRVREEVGANIAGVTRAYIAASKIFSTDALWREIEALDNQVSAAMQIEMMRMVANMLERAVTWILRYRRNNVGIRELVDYFQEGVGELIQMMPKPLAAPDRLTLKRRAKNFSDAGVPRDLAQQVGALMPLINAFDIVEVAKQSGKEIAQVAGLYFNLGAVLDLHWLQRQIFQLSVQSHWHNLAKIKLSESLNAHQRELTAQILRNTRNYKVSKRMIDQWREVNWPAFERHEQMLSELKSKASVDYAMLSVVISGVSGLLVSGA